MRAVIVALIAALALSLAPIAVSAAPPGPPLQTPVAELDAALRCSSGWLPARDTVLLVHGTATNPDESYTGNFMRTLPALGYRVCDVWLPDRALGDIQVSSEYVVHAIRTIAANSGRKVSVIGHSQGALQPRWALRWWPDLADLVDDSISLAGPHDGTLTAESLCAAAGCNPSSHQMRPGSAFLGALNSPGSALPPGVSATSIYTVMDELVQPASSSELDGAANIMVQDVCPGRPVTHLTILWDAVVHDLVVDALQHPGPADPSRLSLTACLQASTSGSSVPAVDFGSYPEDLSGLPSTPWGSDEPTLAGYAS